MRFPIGLTLVRAEPMLFEVVAEPRAVISQMVRLSTGRGHSSFGGLSCWFPLTGRTAAGIPWPYDCDALWGQFLLKEGGIGPGFLRNPRPTPNP